MKQLINKDKHLPPDMIHKFTFLCHLHVHSKAGKDANVVHNAFYHCTIVSLCVLCTIHNVLYIIVRIIVVLCVFTDNIYNVVSV